MVGRTGRAPLSCIAWIAGMLLAFPAIAAPPALRAVLSGHRVEFGQSVDLDLYASRLQPALDALNLAPLNRDFAVDTQDDVERDAKSATQHWRLRLYPRRSGTLRVPALRFDGHATAPIMLQVTPAVDRSTGGAIGVTGQISRTRVWINQPIRVGMRIVSDNPFVWLKTDSVDDPTLTVQTLPTTTSLVSGPGRRRTAYRVDWLIYPQTVGSQTLQLPPVGYQVDGQVTHRFYPPRLHLNVRPLPEFVPPTMPVGAMQVQASLPDRWLLQPHGLAFLTLKVRYRGPAEQRPSAILRQLRSNRDWDFYPPRQLRQTNDENGTHLRVYQIPFAPTGMGLLPLPRLRIQYFDPNNGKLETRFQTLGRALSISRWLRYPVLGLCLFVLYRVLRSGYRRVAHRYRVFQTYRSALRGIRRARTPQDLKQALMMLAAAEGWQANQTLAVWQGNWSRLYPHLPEAASGVHRLQEWLYRGHKSSLEQIRQDLIGACYRRMPALRLIGP